MIKKLEKLKKNIFLWISTIIVLKYIRRLDMKKIFLLSIFISLILSDFNQIVAYDKKTKEGRFCDLIVRGEYSDEEEYQQMFSLCMKENEIDVFSYVCTTEDCWG